MKYEVHNLEGQKLPIIFHYDIINNQNPNIANWHENIEILFGVVGSGQVICNSVTTNMAEGDMFIVNSNRLHSILKNDRFEYFCLIIDSDFLISNGIPVEDLDFDRLIHTDMSASLFHKVTDSIQSRDPFRIAAIRADILNLMVYLARNHSIPASGDEKNHHPSDECIKQAISYIKANYAQKLTLEEIAEKVNLSKYYFSREFKKATGMTVIAFLNATRCRNARKMLLSKQYSINDIASQCGFDNNSYFSKTFKSIMGCLPSEVTKIPATHRFLP